MPGPVPPYREPTPLTRRQRRTLWIAGGVAAAGIASVLAWAQTHQGEYGPSANGCVTLVAPSSLGGQVLHRCGADAQSWCRSAYTSGDRLSLLVRPQCRLAGISPPASPAGTPGS